MTTRGSTCRTTRASTGSSGRRSSPSTTADIRDDHGILGIGCTPAFAIGQRALLVESPAGNVLWDCTPYLDDAIVERISQAGRPGGDRDLAPALLLGDGRVGARVRLPGLPPRGRAEVGDAPGLRRSASGTARRTSSASGLTLIRCGGHFEGAQVLHWAERRALLERRHRPGDPRPQPRQLHVVVPEPRPARARADRARSSRRSSRSRSTRSTAPGSTA